MKPKKEIEKRLRELSKKQADHIKHDRLDEASSLSGIIYGLNWCLDDQTFVDKMWKAIWKPKKHLSQK